jgi:hypothetical protein
MEIIKYFIQTIMTTIRPFSIFDLFKFNNVNLDILTETYQTNFYGKYIAIWGEYCVSAENNSGMIEGYVLGNLKINNPVLRKGRRRKEQHK